MKQQVKTKIGCLAAIVFLFSIGIVYSIFRPDSSVQYSTDAISWAEAAEKCKAEYMSQRPAGTVKVSNCKKRLEDDDYFYFFWSKPLSIFIKKSDGGRLRYPGTCQVSRESGEIVYLTLNKKVLVRKIQK